MKSSNLRNYRHTEYMHTLPERLALAVLGMHRILQELWRISSLSAAFDSAWPDNIASPTIYYYNISRNLASFSIFPSCVAQDQWSKLNKSHLLGVDPYIPGPVFQDCRTLPFGCLIYMDG